LLSRIFALAEAKASLENQFVAHKYPEFRRKKATVNAVAFAESFTRFD